MSIVYRIENPDGSGPYRGSNSKLNDIALGSVAASRHPSPHVDLFFHRVVNRIEDDNAHLSREESWDLFFLGRQFGFETKGKLRDWFSDWVLIEMSEAGAVFAEYEVDDRDTTVGETQIIFRYKNKKKKQYDIIEYFKLREMKIENNSEIERPKQDFE